MWATLKIFTRVSDNGEESLSQIVAPDKRKWATINPSLNQKTTNDELVPDFFFVSTLTASCGVIPRSLCGQGAPTPRQ
jgi:hypothetical protein